MNIGDRLRKIRKDKGLDQGDFANFLNISQQNLSNYETNKRDIPEQIKIKLQQNGVNLNWLISGDGEPFIKNAEEPKKSALIQEIENTAVEAIAPKFIEQDNRIKRIEEELKDLRSLYEQKFKNEPPQPDSISEPAPLYTADYEEPEETARTSACRKPCSRRSRRSLPIRVKPIPYLKGSSNKIKNTASQKSTGQA